MVEGRGELFMSVCFLLCPVWKLFTKAHLPVQKDFSNSTVITMPTVVNGHLSPNDLDPSGVALCCTPEIKSSIII